ncbi:MAG: hypothetical protein M1163_03360, partial [Candidatus Thermoplasmatota archaeon]|nr:hypothetical protein [Candidatus Thermoplasmatota archaeon]
DNVEEFPKFECAISNTKEEYDSEVETFFTQLASLESDLGLLLVSDESWKENYKKILSYLSDLETSVIFKRGSPDAEFVKTLVKGEDLQDEIPDILIRAKNEIPALLIRAQSRTRDVMTLFVKMSRIPRFKDGFTIERFEGLISLRKGLFRRAIAVSKQ